MPQFIYIVKAQHHPSPLFRATLHSARVAQRGLQTQDWGPVRIVRYRGPQVMSTGRAKPRKRTRRAP